MRPSEEACATEKTRQQSVIWLVLEPTQASPWHSWDQEVVARVHDLSLAWHPQKGTGAHGASRVGCGMGSSWWLIPPPHLGMSTSLYVAQGIFSCVPQPWAFLTHITLSLRLSKTLLSLLFLHSICFSSRTCHCKWCWCGVSGPKHQAWRGPVCKPTRFHCSDWSLRYLPRALRDCSHKNAEVF